MKARREAADDKLRVREIEPFRGDLKDIERFKRGASQFDVVIHTAFVFDFFDLDGLFKTEKAAIAACGDVPANTNKPSVPTSGALSLGDRKAVEAGETFHTTEIRRFPAHGIGRRRDGNDKPTQKN